MKFFQIVLKFPYFFLILAIFENQNGHFGRMAPILMKFQSDRMSSRESAKSGQIGAHGLN